jgi:phosphatidylglycerophosphate synthase
VIDARLRPWIDPPLVRAARTLAATGVGADAITIVAALTGIAAAAAVAFGAFPSALVLLLLNRLGDGIDGVVARLTGATDRGAFLDMALDFVVYAAFPLGFAVHAPANALPAAILLASYLANGGAFLAFSVLAQKRGLATAAQGEKSIYYLAGLAEGAETVIFIVAACLFPAAFPLLASAFAALCLMSAGARLVLGWMLLG